MCQAIWAVVKVWIHPITAAKINIFGSPKEAMKKLEEVGVPPSELPEWIGGTNPGTPIFDILLRYVSEGKFHLEAN